ncbi:MAG: hypothetical protein Q4G60_13180 [bacterium]|nr:hypothetical protein [bacterium]
MEDLNNLDLTTPTDAPKLCFIAGIICLLAGIAIGFLLSPATKGIHITLGSNNSIKNSGDGILMSGVSGREKKKKECCN